MRLKIGVMLVAASVLVLPVGAKADQVDFTAIGGTWNWNAITNALGATGNTVIASNQPSGGTALLSGASLRFQTGAFVSGVGTQTNPWVFGSGGFIDVVGGTCGTGCFLGSFTDVQMFNNTSNGIGFQGAFVGGSLSQALLTLLGFPSGTSTNALGFITGGLSPVASGPGASGAFNSANLVLTPTPAPEPSTLVLLCAGLIAVLALARKH